MGQIRTTLFGPALMKTQVPTTRSIHKGTSREASGDLRGLALKKVPDTF